MNSPRDQFRTPLAETLEYTVVQVRERGRRGTRRLAAEFAGEPCEVLEVRRDSDRALRELLEAVTCGTTSGSDTLRSLLPDVREAAHSPELFQLVIGDVTAGPTLPQWCARQREASGFPAGIVAIVSQMLEFFSAMHAAGIGYGVLFPERIRVLGDSVADQSVEIDWPLDPVRLGDFVDNGRTPLGYVAPEFGRPDAAARPDWDLFSVGVVTLWALAGRRPCSEDSPEAPPFREPPAAVSEPDLPMISPRITVPDLPAGWGGFWLKLLAKSPKDRFPDAAAALEAWRALTVDTSATVDIARIAAALHVGVGKFTRNPRNQDRYQVAFADQTDDGETVETDPSAAGSEPQQPELQGFEGFDIAESWSTPLLEVAPLKTMAFAIADGISTVNSGEFAAEVIADSVAATDFSQPDIAAAAPSGLRQILESANSELGAAIQHRAADDEIPSTHRDELLRIETYPSATMVAGLLNRDRAVVGGVGDSRCYLFRAGLLDQLTLDGDRLTQLLRQGEDWRAALQAEDRRELISWLGRFRHDESGQSILPAEPMPVTTGEQYSELSFQPRSGDLLCCCSDGLSDFVDQGRIPLAEILTTAPPDRACRRLVDLANECGGHDNISVIVIRLESTESPEDTTFEANGEAGLTAAEDQPGDVTDDPAADEAAAEEAAVETATGETATGEAATGEAATDEPALDEPVNDGTPAGEPANGESLMNESATDDTATDDTATDDTATDAIPAEDGASAEVPGGDSGDGSDRISDLPERPSPTDAADTERNSEVEEEADDEDEHAV